MTIIVTNTSENTLFFNSQQVFMFLPNLFRSSFHASFLSFSSSGGFIEFSKKRVILQYAAVIQISPQIVPTKILLRFAAA